jgi:hypothetical protein
MSARFGLSFFSVRFASGVLRKNWSSFTRNHYKASMLNSGTLEEKKLIVLDYWLVDDSQLQLILSFCIA